VQALALGCMVAAMLTGCAGLGGHAAPAADNPLQCQPVPGSGGQLCVAITRNRGDIWLVSGDSEYDETRLLESFSCMGGNGAASFGEFSISPGGTYLAVVVAEEGHPFLLFRSIDAILHETAESVPLPTIAVYPGGLSIQGWKSDDQLIVSSDQDLVHYQHGAELEASRDYHVHLPDGRISRQE
jgi:hypothetical protein